MTTSEQVSFTKPSFDTMMSAGLALFVILGVMGALLLHQRVHDFVVTSQLPIFPASSHRAEELPTVSEEVLATLPEQVDAAAAPSAGEPAIPVVPANEGSAPESSSEGGNNAAPLLVPDDAQSALDAPPPATERLTMLVMGIDRREGEEGPWRTDSMILISIDPTSKEVAMLSVPRDLYITIPDYGFGEHRDRINTAYFFGDFYDYPGGGAALAKQAIRRNFGIEVDRYLVMDFNGFRRIIDHVGGITLDVPELLIDNEYPTEDYGIMTVRFEEGTQKMDGERALIYSRTRKSTSDFARARRQQDVIMALRDKVLSLDIIPTLTPTNLSRLIATVNQSIMTDLTADEVLSFAQVANEIKERDIHRVVIDNTMVQAYITYQGAEVLLPDWDTIIPLIENAFEFPLLPVARMAPLPPPLPTVTPTVVWPTWTPTTRGPRSNNGGSNNDGGNNSGSAATVTPTLPSFVPPVATPPATPPADGDDSNESGEESGNGG